MKEVEIPNRVVWACMGLFAVIGVATLIVAREIGQMDAFEYILLGIVAVVCLGYTVWSLLSWARQKVAH